MQREYFFMLKKILASAVCLICFISAFAFFQTPQFSELGAKITFYTGSFDSGAIAISEQSRPFHLLTSVTGESCTLLKEEFLVEDIEEKFSAKMVFKEELPFCTLYYYSSNHLKYKKVIDGKQINLQIAEYSDKLVVGTPIIFGSF